MILFSQSRLNVWLGPISFQLWPYAGCGAALMLSELALSYSRKQEPFAYNSSIALPFAVNNSDYVLFFDV